MEQQMNITASDVLFLRRAIELAWEAEKSGNLPIGAVISLEGRAIAEGRNTAWFSVYNPNRHAEIEALRQVPENHWERSRAMALYTTLEPCLMCLGAIMLHRIGRVVYGAADPYGGAIHVIGHMPPFFEEQASRVEWLGPACPQVCDELFGRAMAMIEKRRGLGL
jgi:tRNA(adenine34) deaminase